MSMLTKFAHVKNYRELSFFQTVSMWPITNRVVQLDKTKPYNLQQLKNWQQMAYRVHDSLTNEKFTFYRVVLDVVTMQFVKQILLRIMLPHMIKKINQALGGPFKGLAPIPTYHPPIVPSLVSKKFDGIRISLDTSTKEKSLETLFIVKDYFQTKKRDLFNKESETAMRGSSLDIKEARFKAIEEEITEYLDKKIKLLVDGHDTKLPWFYHATKEKNLIPIINAKNLQEMNPPGGYGKGVYFSTEDEHNDRYGNHTFAVGSDVISSLSAEYFVPSTDYWNPNKCDSMFVRVRSSVPIEWSSVAHMIVDTPKDKEEIFSKLISNGIEDSAVPIVSTPVLTRLASDIVRRTFQDTHFYELPKQWKRHMNAPHRGFNKMPYIREFSSATDKSNS
jgi:hypothetical protein